MMEAVASPTVGLGKVPGINAYGNMSKAYGISERDLLMR